jgi:hypothetical protein
VNEYQIKLREPATLLVESSDGSKSYKFDIIKTNRYFAEVAEKQVTTDKKWEKVAEYLANHLEVDKSTLAENSVIQFWEAILKLHAKEYTELKNVLGGIACSQQSTLDCPTDGKDGQTSLNKPTETTSPQ